MKSQETHPFHQKLLVVYILILFATSIGVIWWTQRTTPKPEIIDPNIATTEQIEKLPVAETKEMVVSKVGVFNTRKVC